MKLVCLQKSFFFKVFDSHGGGKLQYIIYDDEDLVFLLSDSGFIIALRGLGQRGQQTDRLTDWGIITEREGIGLTE